MSVGPYGYAFTRLCTPQGGWLVDPALRPMLVADAKTHGLSLTEMCVKILADRYGVPYEVTQRSTTPAKDGDVLNLRLPRKLYQVIDGRTKRPTTIPDAVRAALCAHYGLRVPPKIRHTRRRTARAA